MTIILHIIVYLMLAVFYITGFILVIYIPYQYIKAASKKADLILKEKQPTAPKKPLHFTWKSYVMISLYILVFGYLISLLFS